MREIKQFQLRGVSGQVRRIEIEGRIIDYWIPQGGTEHLLIAHDGQNVFDPRTSTRRGRTWQAAQSAIKVSALLGINPPAIVAIWNGNTKEDPWRRVLELSPQKLFESGIKPQVPPEIPVTINDLCGDRYLDSIFNSYLPKILHKTNLTISPEKTALMGSSMGALSTLYAASHYSDRFSTSLALSPHWPIAGNPLVDALIRALPKPDLHRVWMSHGSKGLDREYAPFQMRANELIQEQGYVVGDNFDWRIYPRSGHNEKSWARYLPTPLEFWLRSR